MIFKNLVLSGPININIKGQYGISYSGSDVVAFFHAAEGSSNLAFGIRCANNSCSITNTKSIDGNNISFSPNSIISQDFCVNNDLSDTSHTTEVTTLPDYFTRV